MKFHENCPPRIEELVAPLTIIIYIEKHENIFVITKPYQNFLTLLFCGLDFLLALRHVPYLCNG